jgi:nitrite reductase (NADH) small subunit
VTSVLDGVSPARAGDDERWVAVCALSALQVERAVCAVVGGRQVAIVLTYAGELFAVGQRDPFSGAFVMSRGIVGTRRRDGVDVPTLQSPLFKQCFDLRTGVCLDDPSAALSVHAVREAEGYVHVSVRPITSLRCP